MNRTESIKLIKEVFEAPFNEDTFRRFTRELFNHYEEDESDFGKKGYYGAYIKAPYDHSIKSYKRVGKYFDPDKKEIDILIVEMKSGHSIERARSTQRNFIRNYLNFGRGNILRDAALVAFYSKDSPDWRFSYVKLEYTLKTKKIEFTSAKRSSYLVGLNEKSHTAQKQIFPLLENEEEIYLSNLEEAFSVEKVTKEFFEDYRSIYLKLKKLIDKKTKENEIIQDEFIKKNIDSSNFSKKLLGQMIFLYFLQKKGWLGVGRDEKGRFKKWGEGPKNFLERLWKKEYRTYNNFYNEVLEPLFYNTLAVENDDDYCGYFDCKIPFLNGGLFEPLNNFNWKEVKIPIDNDFFGELFKKFNIFNFTIKEDEPLDKDVAVDPEMLGIIFESLIEENERKSKGAFYTPRQIVHYMAQESIINFLDNKINYKVEYLTAGPHGQKDLLGKYVDPQKELFSEIHREIIPIKEIEDFVRNSENIFEMEYAAKDGLVKKYADEFKISEKIRTNAKLMDEALEGIKICDPAVGSAAFPVAILQIIVRLRRLLSIYTEEFDKTNYYELKKHTIQNSIYGVDIDPGAIEIAKLRLWLSLVVDEEVREKITPLPNLEFNIMQGNSLINKFLEIDFSSDRSDSLIASNTEKKAIKEFEKIRDELFNEAHIKSKKTLKNKIDEILIKLFKEEISEKKIEYKRRLKDIEY
ncbi:class I SAM-dependent DNA methyltransferase, partial [bacterium]|nr:class I SAM-dependent DNA methyltransferase [bacterium]